MRKLKLTKILLAGLLLTQIITVSTVWADETPPVPTAAVPSEQTADAETLPTEIAALPAETTALPAETTALPAETTALPAETTALPAETTALPAETTAHPAETTALPAETTALPAETTAQPAGPASEITEPEPSTELTSPGGGPVTQPSGSRPDLSQVNIVGDIRNLDVVIPIVPVLEKYSYDQMVLDIQNLSSTYGNLMTVNTIGTSLDGREIYEIIVGNPNADRHILIHAGIHAREYMTPLLVMKQIELALSNYYCGSYNGRSIAEMFELAAIHFVPMSNPDGTTISQFGLDGIRSEDLKHTILYCYETDKVQGRVSSNLGSYLSRWKANARGVDLNYSFDAGWAEIPIYTPFASSMSYKGAAPGSEPETQALVNLANQRRWAATISYHSMGQLIYWDYPVNFHRDASRHFGNMVSAATGYRMAHSGSGGGFKDWMQSNAANPAPSLTLEVGRSACPLPLTEYPDAWAKNKSVWAVALEFALGQ